jgi:hypothetical protein
LVVNPVARTARPSGLVTPAVTRLPQSAVAIIKKCSFEKSDLPYYQAFSGFPHEKSSFLSKYYLISIDKN